MKLKDSKNSECPNCKKVFNIHKHRTYELKSSVIPGGWFYHAMNQFENFDQVICPYCGSNYHAKEARLFGIFRSAYTVMAVGMLFVALAVGYLFLWGI